MPPIHPLYLLIFAVILFVPGLLSRRAQQRAEQATQAAKLAEESATKRVASANDRVKSYQDTIESIIQERDTWSQWFVEQSAMNGRAHNILNEILEACYNQLGKKPPVEVNEIIGEYERLNAARRLTEKLVIDPVTKLVVQPAASSTFPDDDTPPTPVTTGRPA